MTMPGFSAESGLGKTLNIYRVARTGPYAARPGVLPQWSDCGAYCSRGSCHNTCTEPGEKCDCRCTPSGGCECSDCYLPGGGGGGHHYPPAA